jgi:hypothetical protein
MPGDAFVSEWYQRGFLVCIFQTRGVKKERSTLIHVKGCHNEKISMISVAEKKRKFLHAAEERKTIT